MIELLISNGANLNIILADSLSFSSSFDLPNLGSSKNLSNFSSSIGAANNLQDKKWKTPLHWAAEKKLIKICELLISRGADVNSTNSSGETPLHTAAQKNFTDIGELLISSGADINAKDINGQTPLHHAVNNYSKAIAELLILKGADIDAKDRDAKTPLHEAANLDKKDPNGLKLNFFLSPTCTAYEIMNLLISRGAEINPKDSSGKTPLHYTTANNSKKTGELLLSKGADFNSTDASGNTPLQSPNDWATEVLKEFKYIWNSHL